MNILYIGNPHNIHDKKWMGPMAKNHKVYVTTEMITAPKVDDLAKAELVKLNITLLPFLGSYSYSKPIQFYRSIQQLKTYIKQYNINLVHAMFAAPYALWLNHISVPFGITTRGSDVLQIIPKLLAEGGVKNKFLYDKFISVFQKASFVTSTSIHQVQAIKKDFNVHSNIIRTGVDVSKIENINVDEYLPKSLNRNKKIIFFPRFIHPVYNIELQIDAIKLLPKELLKEYLFVFIKPRNVVTDYRKKYEAELRQVLKENVVILDELKQEQIFSIYHAAAITVMTPHSDGTPNSALEAMSARCPLIIGNCDYDKEIFDDICYKLMDYQPEKLKALILKALAEYPQELLNKAYQRVCDKANIPNELEKLNQLYIKAVKDKS